MESRKDKSKSLGKKKKSGTGLAKLFWLLLYVLLVAFCTFQGPVYDLVWPICFEYPGAHHHEEPARASEPGCFTQGEQANPHFFKSLIGSASVDIMYIKGLRFCNKQHLLRRKKIVAWAISYIVVTLLNCSLTWSYLIVNISSTQSQCT